jgi:hypothetical protein
MSGPLDLVSPARHIATEIERAAPAALSVLELAASYRHPNTGDVSRAVSLAGAADEAGANVYLIEQALAKLSRNGKGGQEQIVSDDGGYRFADGVAFDDLRFDKKKLTRRINPHGRLGDPFHPMTGQFSDNVRGMGDLSDLRESMREHGWLEDPIFQAISDERGVILVGHRRIAVAKELGIEPRIRSVKCGDGDEADVKRFQYALLSNIGRRDMTKVERQKIVAVLAGSDHDWTQTSIAAALGVTSMTISNDIRELEKSGDFKAPLKSGQRKGRPPGPATHTQKNRDPELLGFIRDRLESGEPAPAQKELKERFGAHETTSQVAIARVETAMEIEEQIRTELAAAGPQCVCPNCGHTF